MTRGVGDLRVTELDPIRRWSKSGGSETTRRFRGPKKRLEAWIQDLEADENLLDWSLEPQDGTPAAVLSFTLGSLDDGTPDEESATHRWNLTANAVEISIFDHPKSVAIEAFEPGTLNAVKELVDTLDQGVEAQFFFLNHEEASAQLQVWLQQFGTSLLRGVSKYPFSQQVVRHTVTVSPNVALTLNKHSPRTVISTSKLLSAEPAIPAYIRADMEDGFWRVIRPKRDETSRGMVSIVREWWFVDYADPFVWDIIQ